MKNLYPTTAPPRALNTDAAKSLGNKNFYFAIVNEGGRLKFYVDGVEVDPQNLKDFTLTGFHDAYKGPKAKS